MPGVSGGYARSGTDRTVWRDGVGGQGEACSKVFGFYSGSTGSHGLTYMFRVALIDQTRGHEHESKRPRWRLCPLLDIRQSLETFLVVTSWWGGVRSVLLASGE